MYGFDPYHVLIIIIGASLLLAHWLPRLAFRRPPAASALLMLFGMLGSLWFPESFAELDPITSPELWEITAEIVVIVLEAGFSGVEITTLALMSEADSALTAATAFCQGTRLRHEIEARDPQGLERATQVAAEMVARRFGRGPVSGRIPAHVVEAVA